MMSTDLTGADLEALGLLSRTLERRADTLRTVTADASSGATNLDRLWQGPDSARFHRQWLNVHRPKLMIAGDELLAAAATIERNRQAQESTSAAGGPGRGGGWIVGPPIAGAAGTGLEVRAPSEVFDQGYMENFIGREHEGQNSPELNSLMFDLLHDDGSDPAALEATLHRVAEIRSIDDLAGFETQYHRYLELAEDRGPLDDLDNLDPQYPGTTASLRYGSVVGEVLGIDPVLAALLNPSGGRVGGGNLSYPPGDDDAVGYHGTFHDAAGYLLNSHGIGPGYDYLGREWFLDETWPLTGQLSGISWWVGNHPELDSDVSQMADLLGDHAPGWLPAAIQGLHQAGFEEGVGQLLHVAEGGADIVQGIDDIGNGEFGTGLINIATGTEIIVDGTIDNIIDVGAKRIETYHDVFGMADTGGIGRFL